MLRYSCLGYGCCYLGFISHEVLGLLGVEGVVLLLPERRVRQQVVQPVQLRLREEEIQRLPDEAQPQDLQHEFTMVILIWNQLVMSTM